jgi:hypothetical protein
LDIRKRFCSLTLRRIAVAALAGAGTLRASLSGITMQLRVQRLAAMQLARQNPRCC